MDDSARYRILDAAHTLLLQGGKDAMSTRAVCAVAGVQAPTIYRIFGDKQGLLNAVTSESLSAYLRAKTVDAPAGDPVDALRRGWDIHVEFGLSHPAVYVAIWGDPNPEEKVPAAQAASAVLLEMVQRIAESGRLAVPAERAAQVVQAAGRGITLTLIGLSPDRRDMSLSKLAREAVLNAIIAPDGAQTSSGDHSVQAAITLMAHLDELPSFTHGEKTLFHEWLARVSGGRALGIRTMNEGVAGPPEP
ncbi:MAG: TetR/AcrR family transcriptional regulator [Chloroflexota bacterium]|nr:TetR/AcrR family transcriptional regulator [Chloroflexota bacterium]